MNLLNPAPEIWVIENFWTPEQCADVIAISEAKGYRAATINTESGTRLVEHVRNNTRVLYTDFTLAETIWQQIKPYAPQHIGNSVAIGLNELFRFYKYQPGQRFKKHRDQSYIRNPAEASYYTFMIYLNNDYTGGETTFNNVTIHPQPGAALIFLHSLEHEGSEVIQGTKYVLRTDIMYRLS